ncbi:MAG: asparagine synthase (glutamine-hydrolyzing) [Verrucomicrobiota bacterium]|nr:asparagine synthase (glutamine-hydrolyzing) [Verrucomicrobiota bacterium]
MCGITGFIDPSGSLARDAIERAVSRMADTLRHRGPDDVGCWADPGCGLALGHRRLSVIDLSPEGHQPMASESGRYVIVYNGEVYNFQELRRELEPLGHRFRGHSDTEVILAAIEQWGVAAAARRFLGMFAFALWDARERRIVLARDRLGVKPLYYGWANGVLMFASELKAFRAHPRWSGEINRGALALFMRHNCIPAPYSIYRDVHKLYPGTLLSVGMEAAAAPGDFSPLPVSEGAPAARLQPEAYWSARTVAERARADPFVGSEDEAAEALEGLLADAVKRRMVADVPLGAFLSGGIDSSAVVALMQAAGGRVKTFTVGFPDSVYDEARHAREVAMRMGTDHTQVDMTPAETLAVIPGLPALYDEPFADSSQIPTFLISRVARRHVTVSLSGDGGDECFGGYNRYVLAPAVWGRFCRLPRAARRAAAGLARAVPIRAWESFFRAAGRLLPAELRNRVPGDTVTKCADIVAADTPDLAYRALTSHWKNPETVVVGGTEPPTIFTDSRRFFRQADFVRRMMLTDLVTYLPDDILTKLDRASMGVGLEARAPFLDHRIVEFSARLPLSFLVRSRTGKHLLRRVLYRHVPPRMLDRPKQGFGLPLGRWLLGPLREWCEALLNEERLRREGFFEPGPIRTRWREHVSGRRDWKHELWDVLMFQAWLEEERRGIGNRA